MKSPPQTATWITLLAASILPYMAAIDIDECGTPLGMESGRIGDTHITASSSFDALSTGPAHSRIRSESGSGAWCPLSQVNATSPAEWIQIELVEESWLTAVESQGRWDHGRGREFPTAYMLEYWRASLGKWARYKDYRGQEIIPGNNDTSTAVKHRLTGAVLVKHVRIIPVSEQTRTVCLRLELYGCANREHVASYTTHEGDFTGSFDGRDSNYDGDTDPNSRMLTKGLGRLFDGATGGQNEEGWMGWRRTMAVSNRVPLELHFSTLREISSLSMYIVDGKWNASAPQLVVLKFTEPASLADKHDQHIEELESKDGSEAAQRWIRINFRTRSRISAIHVELYFRDTAEWTMISEVAIGEPAPLRKAPDELPTSNTAPCWAVLLLVCPIVLTAAIVLCLMCALCRRMRVAGGGEKLVDMSPGSGRTLQLVLKSSGVECKLASGGVALQQEGGYAEPYGDDCHLLGTSTCSFPSFSVSCTEGASKFSTDHHHGYQTNLPSSISSQYSARLGRRAELATLGYPLDGARTVVVKESDSTPSDELRLLRGQLRLLSGLRHHNVMRLVGVLEPLPLGRGEPLRYLVEHAEGGSLRHYLRSRPTFKQTLLLSITTQVAAGMAYLESLHLIHGQLCAQHCYVDSDGTVKVGEFGVRHFDSSSVVRWMAWESALEGRFSTTGDVWSFGVCAWEICSLCAELPFGALDEHTVWENLRSLHATGQMRHQLPLPSQCPSESFYRDVMQPCWRRCESERPSFAELHRLLQKLSISSESYLH